MNPICERVPAEQFLFVEKCVMAVMRPVNPVAKMREIEVIRRDRGLSDYSKRILIDSIYATHKHKFIGFLTTDRRIVDPEGVAAGVPQRGDSNVGVMPGDEFPIDQMPWFLRVAK